MLPSSALKERAHQLGFELVGVADPKGLVGVEHYKKWIEKGYHGPMEYLANHLHLRQDVDSLLPGVRSVICVGLNYNQPVSNLPDQPRIARYALGRDYHKVIRTKLKSLGRLLESHHPGLGWRACVDSAPIFEREYSHLAGLGWFGKNTCLINSQRGSWFLLGTLLTTLAFEPDKPALGGCGTCRLCIDACPTQCIVLEEGKWQVDGRKCISTLTIEQKGDWDPSIAPLIGDWTFGCDICQEVCPFNQVRPTQPSRATTSQEPDLLSQRQWPDLVQLTQISHEDWDRLTQGSAVRRVGHEGIKRNAAQNLHNRQNLSEDKLGKPETT
ncbi:MAG: tRNA epoxyqueuosine(34) reductase QueG [Fimbriimonadaceae bacterium]|nr:tRNA epoxyqueuosine(34) reductase QueG [Fimbriimonadaceae bacterium]